MCQKHINQKLFCTQTNDVSFVIHFVDFMCFVLEQTPIVFAQNLCFCRTPLPRVNISFVVCDVHVIKCVQAEPTI